jgi:hypothetical protein
MAGNVSPKRVLPNLGINGITGLYDKLQEFDKLVAIDIAKMPDGDAKSTAKAMLDASNERILPAATELRTATREQKLYEEMVKKFSPTGKFDKVYEYEKDGKTLRFDPIQWVVQKTNLWGRDFQYINVGETRKNNKQ